MIYYFMKLLSKKIFFINLVWKYKIYLVLFRIFNLKKLYRNYLWFNVDYSIGVVWKFVWIVFFSIYFSK